MNFDLFQSPLMLPTTMRLILRRQQLTRLIINKSSIDNAGSKEDDEELKVANSKILEAT